MPGGSRASPHALSLPRLLLLELWDAARLPGGAPAAPQGGWQQAALLGAVSDSPVGTVVPSQGGLSFGFSPAGVQTDVKGTATPPPRAAPSLTPAARPGLLRSSAASRLVLDRRPCLGAAPSVPAFCATLCPLYTASGSNTPSSCAAACAACSDASRVNGSVGVGVWNTGTTAGGGTLQFALQASCAAAPAALPCPRPAPDAPPCGGHGTCLPAASGGLPTCACNATVIRAGGPTVLWGDAGCGTAMPLLAPSSPAPQVPSQTLAYNSWAYFAAQGEAGKPLTVRLTRTGGDPLLIVRRADEGATAPNTLPSLADWASYGDVASYTAAAAAAERIYPSLAPAAGDPTAPVPLLIAVYANDAVASDAAFSLTVSQDAAAACPGACSGAGTCARGVCLCGPGRGGADCGGELLGVPLEGGYLPVSTLAANHWLYIAFTMPAQQPYSNSWSLSGSAPPPTATLQLQHSGAHPSLMLRAGLAPSLAPGGYDWVPQDTAGVDAPLRTGLVTDGNAQWQLPTALTPPGQRLFIALYVFPGDVAASDRRHSNASCTLSLAVTFSTAASGLAISPSFLSIVLGVVLSMFLCLIMSICRRYGLRWANQRQPHSALHQLNALHPVPLHMRPRAPPPRGLDAAVVAAFRELEFQPGTELKGDATCAVCLADYEAGEGLRVLPFCDHAFHRSCIDEWLAAHDTCPLCRVGLRGPAMLVSAEVELTALAPGRRVVNPLGPRGGEAV